MNQDMAEYQLVDLTEGQFFAFTVTVTAEEIDRFAELSGDTSPLHLDTQFAQERGFSTRVAHGVLLASYVSRMIGVHLPGRNALLQSLNLKFLTPVYAGETVRILAVVDQISPGTQAAVLAVKIEQAVTGKLFVRGKIQVGFTREMTSGE